MRKKYLSALLFGALLFASAGTFTSCKDYDDDINNLQSQITANADAIKALQDKVNSGKWITELTAIEGGFKVTFSDGQSFEIVNGEKGENGSEWTIGEDGYWYKDNEKTEYKAAIDGAQNKVVVPTVGEDGYWYLVDEESGELVKSEYKANGAAYAVEANGGYNIYLPGENGEMLDPIYVPGAAGSITSMTAELREEGTADGLSINLYTFNPSDADKKAWKDLTSKDVTSNKYILSSAEKIGLRINPVNVDASGINFVLYNSKNEKLPGVTFAAAEYKDYVTSATRAGYGNGLYSLSMKPFELKDDAAKDELTDLFKSSSENILYAVSADVNVRAEYNIAIADLTSKEAAIGDVTINEEAIVDDNNTTTVTTDKKNNTAVDTKTANVVSVETPADLYDMWLTAEEEDVNLFKLVFDQEKHTFTINADPDVLTKAYFVLTVHTIDNSGKLTEQEVNIYVSDRIAAEAEYAKRTLNVVENKADKSDANVFKADMATMTNALGDQLDAWKRKVSTFEVVYYSDAECKTKVADAAASGIELTFIGADGKEAEIKNAADMKFYVTNADASQKFKVDNTYYAKVTFKGAAGELNSVVIPFEFKIPALSTMLTPRAGYVSDGVINAYFYDAENNSTAVELNRYFTINNDAVKESAVDFTDDNKYSDGAYYLEETSDVTFGTSKVDIIGDFKDNKVPAGYGKAVTIKLSNEKYLGWSYQANADKVYTFKICLMSPIYEGTIAPVSGTSISISANDVVNGAKITDKDITGVDYNGNKYCVVSDNEKATGETPNATWYKNSQIKSVTMTKDKDSYIDNVTYQKATSSEDGVVNGWFIVKGRSLSVTQEIELPVTVEDAWGYKKTVNVPATIVVK